MVEGNEVGDNKQAQRVGMRKSRSAHILSILASLTFSLLCLAVSANGQSVPPANVKVAFFGDQALGADALAVLNLIKAEGAQAALHSGDFDYVDNAAAREARMPLTL